MSIITDHTIADFVEEVSQQQHAMAGAVIAASAAQAAALGLACMQISCEVEMGTAVTQSIERMSHIQSELLAWCGRDADAIAEYVALRDAGETLAGQRLLCQGPAAVCQIAAEAARILQDFRPSVVERVRDDLEMSISLLAGAARTGGGAVIGTK